MYPAEKYEDHTGEYFTRIQAPPCGKKSVVRQKMGGKSSKFAIFNKI